MQPLAYAPAGGEPTDSTNYFPKPPQASLQTALKDIEKLHSQTGDEVLLDDFISPSLSAGIAAEGPPRSVRNAKPVNGLLAAQQTAGGSNAPQPTPPIGAYAALDAIQQPLAPGVDVIPVMSTAGPGPTTAMAATGQTAHEGGSGGTGSTASDASVANRSAARLASPTCWAAAARCQGATWETKRRNKDTMKQRDKLAKERRAK